MTGVVPSCGPGPGLLQRPDPGAPASGGRIPAGASRAGFGAVVAFYLVYFFRPEDFIPGLSAIPIEKIVGGIAALALAGALAGGRFRPGRVGKLMLAFLGWLCLCIPTAMWRGNSFSLIVDTFSKCIVIVLATLCLVDSLAGCRRVIFAYTSAMLTNAFFSFGHAREVNRMYGIGRMFSDPNDLALNLCMVLPFCVMFSVLSRSRTRKLLWAAVGCFDVAAIVSTYSRGGFLALAACVLVLAWKFRGGVRKAVVILLIGACIAAGSFGRPYLNRLDTILHPNRDKTDSAETRMALLKRSVQITLDHPLLGVGPGDFPMVSGDWHVTHDTFTQLSAEAGIPSLLIFAALMWCGFEHLWSCRGQPPRSERGVMAASVFCSLIAYLVGGVFLSTAYWLAPYLLVALSALVAAAPSRTKTEGGISAAWAGPGAAALGAR